MNYKVREKLIWFTDLILALMVAFYIAVKRDKKLAGVAVFMIIVIVLAIGTIMGWINWFEITYTVCARWGLCRLLKHIVPHGI